MKNERILVQSSSGKYAILCSSGVLRDAAHEIRKLGKFSRIHVVSSPKVWRAVGKGILRNFSKGGHIVLHLMNDAESAKNLATAEKLHRSLVRAGIDRHSLLIAVGGGVVGDVAAFELPPASAASLSSKSPPPLSLKSTPPSAAKPASTSPKAKISSARSTPPVSSSLIPPPSKLSPIANSAAAWPKSSSTA